MWDVEGREDYPDHSDMYAMNRVLSNVGLYCKDMTGDGNCMFRALADQIDGTPETHGRIRGFICDYMERNPQDFAPFIEDDVPWGRYMVSMRTLGTYGGNLELVAFARCFSVDVKVYQLGTNVFVISGSPPNSPNDMRRAYPPVHIAYHSWEHYSSIRNCNGPYSGPPNIRASITSPSALSNKCANTSTSPPNSKEKMVMASTGVTNLSLVRELMVKHYNNPNPVIDELMEMIAQDPSILDQTESEQQQQQQEQEKQQKNVDHTKDNVEPSEPCTKNNTDPSSPSVQTPKPNKPKKKEPAPRLSAREKKALAKKKQKENAKIKKLQKSQHQQAADLVEAAPPPLQELHI
ncbi:2-oxoglutarate dehydrogenase E1 component [Mycoemilia scoparia]|uniref:2-oxoglutarate dehydrogenase E1 component n=1 Tax=Mycoemilia scoparia TaxID=417184 RepID=A0A9W8DQS0_9FUNG|nr:2-oxoglutarate dehydrogenase E1 component [Mycoemilia scoparia]